MLSGYRPFCTGNGAPARSGPTWMGEASKKATRQGGGRLLLYIARSRPLASLL